MKWAFAGLGIFMILAAIPKVMGWPRALDVAYVAAGLIYLGLAFTT